MLIFAKQIVMLVFWLWPALLVVVVAMLLHPLCLPRDRRRVAQRRERDSSPEQMRELEADLRSGAIGARDFESASSELKARLLADTGDAEAPRAIRGGRAAAIAVGTAIPLLAVGIYLALGSPQALGPVPAADPAHQLSPEQIEAMVERLAERLKSVPACRRLAAARPLYSAFGRFRNRPKRIQGSQAASR